MALPVTTRDIRFDSLRGLMLVCMTINHLPSPFRILTDESVGLFSAAEGFIFLSGLLAGLVYTRRLVRDGAIALREAARQRASLIYRWHVGSFIAALLLVRLTAVLFGFCSQNSPQLFYSHPFLAVVLGLTLLHQPGLFDILPLYCALVLALPFALVALSNGRRAWVLGISFVLWLASQWSPPIDGAPLYPVHVGTFNLFAWQFLFCLGVVIGHARATDSRPLITFRPWLIAAAAGVAVYGWGVQHMGWRPPWSDQAFGVSLNKPSLGGLRIASFGSVAYLVGVVGTYFPRLLSWRPLAFLGRHSLAVVAIQSVSVLLLLEFSSLYATTLRTVLTSAAAIGILFAGAWVHQALQRRTPEPDRSGRSSIDARQVLPASVETQHGVRAA
jgi:hypothetical protein